MATGEVRIPNDGALSVLDSWLTAAAGPVIARLYDNNVVYDPTNSLSDYQEASFVGYSAVGPISWPAASINPEGKAESDSGLLQWDFTAGSGTATVFGIYLTDDMNTVLLAVIPFDSAVVLTPAVPTLQQAIKLSEVSEF